MHGERIEIYYIVISNLLVLSPFITILMKNFEFHYQLQINKKNSFLCTFISY